MAAQGVSCCWLAWAVAKVGWDAAGQVMVVGAKATLFLLKVGRNVGVQNLVSHLLELALEYVPGAQVSGLDPTHLIPQKIGRTEADWTTDGEALSERGRILTS